MQLRPPFADSGRARLLLDHSTAMRYYLSIMARIKNLTLVEPLKVCSIKLPPTAADMLDDLSQDATDTLGRPVSSSALVRALLLYLAQQPPSWVDANLYPLVEQEIARGRVWGKKKRM